MAVVVMGITLWLKYTCSDYKYTNPDSKVHGTSMGSIWGRQDPGGSHVGPMNFAIWEVYDIVIFVLWVGTQ